MKKFFLPTNIDKAKSEFVFSKNPSSEKIPILVLYCNVGAIFCSSKEMKLFLSAGKNFYDVSHFNHGHS